MIFQITATLKDSIRTVKVDGRLVSYEAEVLVRACQPHLARCSLDLPDLRFAKAADIWILQGATVRQVEDGAARKGAARNGTLPQQESDRALDRGRLLASKSPL